MPKFLMLAVIVIGGASMLYQWPGAPPLLFNSRRGIAKFESVPDSEAPAPKPKEPKVARPKSKVGAVKPQPGNAPSKPAEPELPPEHTDPPAIASPKAEFPFPTSHIVKKGTTAKELRSRFGAPSFDIASTSEGRVLEKFYYLNRERNRLTVITLENGILVSANSLSSPYFQLPSARAISPPAPLP